MLKGVNPNFYDLAEHQFISGLDQHQLTQAQYNEALDEAIYGSDLFSMYAYKIKRCTRMRSHDWTECPYAHHGEKAQRRDPRKVPYSAIACPAFRNGRCPKGDDCEFAHGVFEYWLHPARYRTRACNAGRFCQRKVCFFAHTPDQLRNESKFKCPCACKAGMEMMNGRYHHQLMIAAKVSPPSSGGGAQGSTSTSQVPRIIDPYQSSTFDGISDFLKSLRALKIKEDEEKEQIRNHNNNNNNNSNNNNNNGGFEAGADSDLPHLDWISELVNH